MTDGTQGTVPAPRTDADAVVASSEPDAGPSVLAKAGDIAEKVGDRAGEVAEKVGDRVGEVAERVGDAVERAATATGRFASDVVDRLRNTAEITEERGTTTIANEVVEKIAGIAAREVDGVHDLGGDTARVFAAVKERIGLGEADNENKGVRVRLTGRAAALDLTIVIVYGYVVYTVTEKVRAQVISAVESLLGLEVTEVNIIVDDVHVDRRPAA
jgi:uncharacterized alkaline shock family protein YloU